MGEVQLPAGEFPCRDHMDREGLHAEKGAVSPGAQPPAQRGSGACKTSRMGGGAVLREAATFWGSLPATLYNQNTSHPQMSFV